MRASELLKFTKQVYNGELENASAVYSAPHDVLYDACEGTQFVISKGAAERMLQGYMEGALTRADVNQWAAFVQDGRSPQLSSQDDLRRYSGTKYAHPIDFEYDPTAEDAVVSVVNSLRWVGVDEDDVIDEDKAAELIAGLR